MNALSPIIFSILMADYDLNAPARTILQDPCTMTCVAAERNNFNVFVDCAATRQHGGATASARHLSLIDGWIYLLQSNYLIAST